MSWAHYLLQVNIYLTVFYVFYRLLLDKETYFNLNRIYLLSAAILSLGIPFIQLDWLTQQSVSQQLSVGVGQLEMMVLEDTSGPQQSMPWGAIIAFVYAAGLTFFMLRFCYQLYLLSKLKTRVVPGTAFSFFKFKSIHAELPAQQVIHKHEDIHMEQLHSLDVLFFELFSMLNWFNPIVHLYKSSIKHIHEYLADEEAATFQGDKEQYALLLLSAAFKVSPNALSNSFYNESLIKKRIYMLHREKSKRRAILKYGIYLPLFSGMLILSSATLRQNEDMLEATNSIPLENPLSLIESNLPYPAQMPKEGQMNQTEWATFYSFVGRTIKYPEQAKLKNIQGNVQTKFTVEQGEVKGMDVLTKLGYGLDAEVMKSILNYTGFKDIKNGDYVVNVGFRLEGIEAPIINAQVKAVDGYQNLDQIIVKGFANGYAGLSDKDAKVMDFVNVDNPPKFPGGIEQFYTYLGKEIIYPEAAKRDKVKGKVFLSFIVEKDGSLNEINIVKGLTAETDEEAARVLKLSPKWLPGKLKGETVRVKYHLPISFEIQSDQNKTVPIDASKSTDAVVIVDQKRPTTNGEVKNIKVQVTAKNTIVVDKNQKSKSDPVYKIDGVVASKEDMSKINTDMIQSVDVVKGTADNDKYPNGLVLITLKKESVNN